MDKIRSQRIPILISLVVLILLSAAVPFPKSAALSSMNEKSDLVALKIQNESSGYAYVWLDGPAFYYFAVKPGETQTYTVQRGEYSKEISYCGARESSNIDLSRHTKLVMPVCGANARQSPTSPHVVDVTNTLKIVKVTLENEADSRVLAILTGPSTYVFSLDKDATKEYTIAKGDYEVQYFACGAFSVKEWSAYHQGLLKFKCPK
jgi:hypothetical protein